MNRTFVSLVYVLVHYLFISFRKSFHEDRNLSWPDLVFLSAKTSVENIVGEAINTE